MVGSVQLPPMLRRQRNSLSARTVPRTVPRTQLLARRPGLAEWQARKVKEDDWRESIGLRPRYRGAKFSGAKRKPKGREALGGEPAEPLLAGDKKSGMSGVSTLHSDSNLLLVLMLAAAVPIVNTLVARGAAYHPIATLTAAVLSSIVAIAVVTTPVAQMAYNDIIDGSTTGSDADLQDRATPVGCCSTLKEAAKGWLAWGVQYLMGVAGLFQMWVLSTGAADTTIEIVVTLTCATVQIADSFGSWIATSAVRPCSVEKLSDALMEGKRRLESSTLLAADTIMTRGATFLTSKSIFSRVARQSLRLTYRSSRNVLSLIKHAKQPWWAGALHRLDSVGYMTRQSPLKVLILIFEVVAAVDGLSREAGVINEMMEDALTNSTRRRLHQEVDAELSSTQHIDIVTSISTLLIDFLVVQLLSNSVANAALASATLTYFASQDFVRKRVRPLEEAEGRMTELARRVRSRRRSAAVARLRAAMAAPLLVVHIDLLLDTIADSEASLEQTGLDPALISEAKDYAAKATEAQETLARSRSAKAAQLERLMRVPPLGLDSVALHVAIDEARDAGLDAGLRDAAVACLQEAVSMQRRHALARQRLQRAMKEPTPLVGCDPTSPAFGARIDTTELADAIREAQECWLDQAELDSAAMTLSRAVASQRKLNQVVAAFFGRLRARTTLNVKRREAQSRLETAATEARRALQALHGPTRVSDLLEDAVTELGGAFAEARACNVDAALISAAEATKGAAESALRHRAEAEERFERAAQASIAAVEGFVHCSLASVERVMSKLRDAIAHAQLVEVARVNAAERLLEELEMLCEQRAHAQSRLEASMARSMPATTRSTANWMLSSNLEESDRLEASHAIAAARETGVDAMLVSAAERYLLEARLTAAILSAVHEGRAALEELRSRLGDPSAAAEALAEARARLASALDEASAADAAVAEPVVASGRDALSLVSRVLTDHSTARDQLAKCSANAREAQRVMDRIQAGPSALNELTDAVTALSEAVSVAKDHCVASQSIRDAQLLLTRARAAARSHAATMQVARGDMFKPHWSAA